MNNTRGSSTIHLISSSLYTELCSKWIILMMVVWVGGRITHILKNLQQQKKGTFLRIIQHGMGNGNILTTKIPLGFVLVAIVVIMLF